MSDQDGPAWFRAALAVEPETGVVEVAGVGIHYRAWGKPAPGGIVLVHGGAAHSRWWDHIAPFFSGERRVVALDLSGHGDSGRRPAYRVENWAEEVLAVAAHAGAGPDPVVIGHSMGGMVTLATARLYGDRMAGAVVVDTPIWELQAEDDAATQRAAFGPLRVYGSREEALGRFRIVPDQDEAIPAVLTHIAETSVRPYEGGWAWKFDPAMFAGPDRPLDLVLPECRLAIFRAEHGLVPADMGDRIHERLDRIVPVIEIPFAAHHVMIDQPLALITGLRTLLADWTYSDPHRPA